MRDETRETLLGAVDQIHEHGWCRGALSDPEGRVCLEGAIWRAAGGNFETGRDPVPAAASHGTWARYHAAMNHVGTVLEGSEPFVWNDHDATDADAVIDVLKRASDLP